MHIDFWFRTVLVSVLILPHTLVVPLAIAATGLPFESSFESADFSEWDGGLRETLSVTSGDASQGRFSTQGVMTSGQTTDNYMDYVFGDHARIGGEPVTPANGIWLQFDSKFDDGFRFGRNVTLHKIAIINFEDENGRRRYQVLVTAWTETGEYFLDHLKWNADRSFNKAIQGLAQNVGTPTRARLGQWDRLLVFVKPNTPGNMDGAVRLWVNGELKAEYQGITLREDSPYNPNKLILSNYAMDTTTEGIQRWDNFYLGEADPRVVARPMPPRDLTAQ